MASSNMELQLGYLGFADYTCIKKEHKQNVPTIITVGHFMYLYLHTHGCFDQLKEKKKTEYLQLEPCWYKDGTGSLVSGLSWW